MIVKPTVFVLGAGASQPYSFPVGSELATSVCQMMPTSVPESREEVPLTYTQINRWLQRQQIPTPVEAAITLRTRFAQSGCLTLDEFVEAEGNRRFLPLVKAGIAHRLVACEQDGLLSPGKADWMAYLFREMRTAEPSQFSENKVKVVTFNFDRCFERKLFLMLRGAYGLADADAAQMAATIPVAHVHGRLGNADWELNPTHRSCRGYNPNWDHECDRIALSDIRIIHEEVAESDDLSHAKEWLKTAHTICFLGFGFHPTNVKRLGLDAPFQTAALHGTALGLSEPERARAIHLFKTTPALYDMDCYRLLREVRGVLNTERG